MPARFGRIPILIRNSLVDYDKQGESAFVNDEVEALTIVLTKKRNDESSEAKLNEAG
jgi:hypothetical protein